MAELSEARKRANQKWDKENMATLGCRVRKDLAERFKDKCISQGLAPNAVLRDFIERFVADDPE